MKKLTGIGIKKKGETGFKIDPEPVEQKPPPVGAHVIHNGTGTSFCSECAQPVNVTLGTCENCFAEFGGCG